MSGSTDQYAVLSGPVYMRGTRRQPLPTRYEPATIARHSRWAWKCGRAWMWVDGSGDPVIAKDTLEKADALDAKKAAAGPYWLDAPQLDAALGQLGVSKKALPGYKKCRLMRVEDTQKVLLPSPGAAENSLEVVDFVRTSYNKDGQPISVQPAYRIVRDASSRATTRNARDVTGAVPYGEWADQRASAKSGGACGFVTHLTTGAVGHRCSRHAGAGGVCDLHASHASGDPRVGGAEGVLLSGGIHVGLERLRAGGAVARFTLPTLGQIRPGLPHWPVLTQAQARMLHEGLNGASPSDDPDLSNLIAQIQTGQEPDFVFLVNDDDYGRSLRPATRSVPWGFSPRHHPIRMLRGIDKSYAEWLIGLGYTLRFEFPEFHDMLFDPAADTIGTLESNILASLGRVETEGTWFDRPVLFADWQPFATVMHKFLHEYARRPQSTDPWMSPLSERFIALDSSELKRQNPQAEAQALLKLGSLIATLTDEVQTNVDPPRGPAGGFVVPRTSKLNKDTNGAGTTVILGVLEDELMAILARLQYQYSGTVNLDSVRDFDATLQAVENWVSKDVLAYMRAHKLGGLGAPSKDVAAPIVQPLKTPEGKPMVHPIWQGMGTVEWHAYLVGEPGTGAIGYAGWHPLAQRTTNVDPARGSPAEPPVKSGEEPYIRVGDGQGSAAFGGRAIAGGRGRALSSADADYDDGYRRSGGRGRASGARSAVPAASPSRPRTRASTAARSGGRRVAADRAPSYAAPRVSSRATPRADSRAPARQARAPRAGGCAPCKRGSASSL